MKRFIFAVLSCALLATTLRAQTPATPPAQAKIPPDPIASPAPNSSPAQKYFSDVELINQHGETKRFYSDLLKGKVVVISSFMATCKSACQMKNRNIKEIQDAAGERLGKDVIILSITVDPITDTPPRLEEYAKSFQAKPGWHFLTGKKENVDWALYKIGQYVVNKEEHMNILVIGNEATGLWKKAFGLARADELIKVFESVLNDTAKATK